MSKKQSELTKYLLSISKGYELGVAEGLGYVNSQTPKDMIAAHTKDITPDEAVKIGEITKTDPSTLLMKQVASQMDARGIKSVEKVVEKPRTETAPRDVTPSRSPAFAPQVTTRGVDDDSFSKPHSGPRF